MRLPKNKVMAILNLTPDSFSDNGRFFSKATALLYVESIIDYISILDVGAESTRPGAEVVPYQEEISRLSLAIEEISQICRKNSVLVSMDSRNKNTINWASKHGYIDIINDVSADCEKYIDILQQNQHMQLVMMHSLTVPADKNIIMQCSPEEVCQEICNFFVDKTEQLSSNGISGNRIIVDPGLGFGKNKEQNWCIVNNFLKHRSKLDPRIRVLFGHSRKSFLCDNIQMESIEERDKKTYNLSELLLSQGADFVRVHNVELS